MDKETLSNYGWIVIAVLVLVVMIALATPFGKFISNAVQSTTKGLFSASQNALNSAGVPGLTIEDQEFDVPDGNGGAEETPVPVGGSATFNAKTTEGCDCIENYGYHDCFVSIEPATLTWDELKLAENGTKYGYGAYGITDTGINLDAFACCPSLQCITIPSGVIIPDSAFSFCENLQSVTIPDGTTRIGPGTFGDCGKLQSITIPDSVTYIGAEAFSNCRNLQSITFEGTTEQWNEIVNGGGWNRRCPEITVTCTDGTITIPAW